MLMIGGNREAKFGSAKAAAISFAESRSVLLHTELECWAGWVSMNLTGGTFHGLLGFKWVTANSSGFVEPPAWIYLGDGDRSRPPQWK